MTTALDGSPLGLAGAIAAGLDPVVFAGAAGITPDGWQRAVLRSRADRLLLNCSRQSGKSLTVAVLAAWTALYKPGSLTLMISPSERQSGELFRKVVDVYRAGGRPQPVVSQTAFGMELGSGSRLLALPGSETTTRGFSAPSLLLVDECARCPDELLLSVLPMLAVSKGRMICLSTPAGRRGLFFEWWTEGPGWEKVQIPATECPRITAEWLEEQRTTMPRPWFEQEFLCLFREVDDAVFSFTDVAGILVDDEPVFPQLAFPGGWPGTVGAAEGGPA